MKRCLDDLGARLSTEAFVSKVWLNGEANRDYSGFYAW
jgi:hypothetical protein